MTEDELNELDAFFLQSISNYYIFEELCGESDVESHNQFRDLFDPLEFFRIYQAQIVFIEQNKNKPLFVSRTLEQLQLSKKQLDYLYYNLEIHFEGSIETDELIHICYREINKLRDSLGVEAERNIEKQKVLTATKIFDFDKVLIYLETLSYEDKILYLIVEKTKYEQADYEWLMTGEKSFAEKCQLEIEKLEKLAQRELCQKPKIIERGIHKELTIDRTIFLLNRLIPSFVDCEATKKAKFINFLTGFDYETVRQRFSSITKKDADKPQAFKKDMEVVCNYLNILSLFDLVREIKKDLQFK